MVFGQTALVVTLEKLIHTVFVGKIAKFRNFLEGKSSCGGQLFDFCKLLAVDRFFKRFAGHANKNTMEMPRLLFAAMEQCLLPAMLIM